jgi:hypothetical protein
VVIPGDPAWCQIDSREAAIVTLGNDLAKNVSCCVDGRTLDSPETPGRVPLDGATFGLGPSYFVVVVEVWDVS